MSDYFTLIKVMEKLLVTNTRKKYLNEVHEVYDHSNDRTMLDDLPNELLYKILVNLRNWYRTVDYLWISKLVCKRWCTVVNELIGTYVSVYCPREARPCVSEEYWKPLSVIESEPISGMLIRLCYIEKPEIKCHYRFPHLVRFIEMEHCFPFKYFEKLLSPLFNLTEFCLHSQILLGVTNLELRFLENLPIKIFRLVTGWFWSNRNVRIYGLLYPVEDLNKFVDNLGIVLSLKWKRLISVELDIVLLRERELDIYDGIFHFLVNHKRTLRRVQVKYVDISWVNEFLTEEEQELHCETLRTSSRAIYEQYINQLQSWTDSLTHLKLHAKGVSSPHWVNTLWYEWFVGQRNLINVSWKPQMTHLLQPHPFPVHLFKANELTLNSVVIRIDTSVHHRIDLSIFSGCRRLLKLIIIGTPMEFIPIGVRTDVSNGHLLPKTLEYVFIRDLGLPFYVNVNDWSKGLPNVKCFTACELFQPRGLVLHFMPSIMQNTKRKLRLYPKFKQGRKFIVLEKLCFPKGPC